LQALSRRRNDYRWIYRFFEPQLEGDVIEVGAGLGTFATQLLAAPKLRRLLLVEPDPSLSSGLVERFGSDARVSVVSGVLSDLDPMAHADRIVAVNVLEHIDDTARFLADAAQRLSKIGRLLLFVPAGPWLFGSLDRAFDHYRRYTKGSLLRSLRASGFLVTFARYVNLPGVLSWFFAGKVMRQTTIAPWQAL